MTTGRGVLAVTTSLTLMAFGCGSGVVDDAQLLPDSEAVRVFCADDGNACTLEKRSKRGCLTVPAPDGTPCAGGSCVAGRCVVDPADAGSAPADSSIGGSDASYGDVDASVASPDASALPSGQFVVAPGGSDQAAGTADAPFATLERARAAVAELKARSGLPEGGITVLLRGGVHRRTSTFVLTAGDSGEPGRPVTYKSWPGEVARLQGGVVIEPGAWSTVTSDDRLHAAARGNVLRASLAGRMASFGAYGTRGGSWFKPPDESYAAELFFNGLPQTLARWPNAGATGTGIKEGRLVSSGGSSNTVAWSGGTLPASLDGAISRGEAYCVGNAKEYAPLTVKITGKSGGTLTVQREDAQGWYYPFEANNPFFVQNVLEELDSPGEYWLDTAGGDLYFWPPSAPASGEAVVSALTSQLVDFSGASNVVLDGLVIEAGRNDLVRFSAGSSNLLRDCRLRNAGRTAVRIGSAVTNSGIVGGEIAFPADHGVHVSGSANFVRQCDIHHTTRLTYGNYWSAIFLFGNGNTIANNAIHDLEDQAIWLHDSNHVVELNEIWNTNRSTNDSGAIYTQRRIGQGTGNVIRFNYIHDIDSWWGRNDVANGAVNMGIYLDDGWTDALVQGNIVRNVSLYGIHHGGGEKAGDRVTVEDNILEANGNGAAWPGGAYVAANHNPETPPYPTSAIFRRNLIGLNNTGGRAYYGVDGWDDVIAPKYPRTYPGFADYSGNVGNWYQGGVNGVDPKWVDPADPRKGLQAGSPAFSIQGWHPIPFAQIGLVR